MAELDPVKLSAMTAVSALHLGDLFYVGFTDAGSETGYFSRKIEAQDVAESFFDDFEFPLKLDETNSARIFGAINEVAKKGNVYIGTCDTAGATAAKAVTVSSDQNFKLHKGTTINVKFANNNTANNVTLAVNGGTAYPIYYNNSQYNNATTGITGQANINIEYIFDGSYWVWRGRGSYTSYSSMPEAEAVAGTATSDRLIKATILKAGIKAHAIPQIDSGERVIGTLGADTLYEKVFTFAYSDMQGGAQSTERVYGAFVLDSGVNYKYIMLTDSQVIHTAPADGKNIWSFPVPNASASGQYSRVMIQKSYSEPPAYNGVPFIYFDTTFNAALIKNNDTNIIFVFTVRYTKEATP